jgi:hypothetical protein
MELPTHFHAFLSIIEPTNGQKTEVSTVHDTLRSRLREGDFAEYFKGSFLYGSYGRDTAIRQTKTVDIVVVANYNRSFWEPHTSLSHLKRVLSKSFKVINVQNGSIHIVLNLLDLNIIPAIIEDGFLKVPDRDSHNWVPSNVHRHIQLCAELNKSKNDLYKPLIKSLKCWRDHKMAEAWKPGSFLLECLVYDYVANSALDSVPKAIEGFLWYTHNKYKPFKELQNAPPIIREIGSKDKNVAKNWTYMNFCNFIDEVYRSWILSHQALGAQSKLMSVDRWRQLFGDAFPVDI